MLDTVKRCKRCLDYATWKGGVLRCSKCGQMIALRYRIGEEVKLYIFQKFRTKRKEIKGRKDCFQITKDGDLLGDISFKEFDDLRDYFRSNPADLFSVQKDEGRLCEDCESEDSEGFQQVDDLDNSTY